MSVQINQGKALRNLSLTPLIDIVFLLLVFFLVASRFAAEEREAAHAAEIEQQVKILLPEASEAKPLSVKPEELFIQIDQHGRYEVAGKLLTIDELGQVLKTSDTNNPGRQSVIIRADRRCRWEFVVGAMNACNKAHIFDYRVTTTRGG